MARSTKKPPALQLTAAYRPQHHWHFSSNPVPTYSRQLGLLENKFDLASQDLGQSDTFLQLTLRPDGLPLPAGGSADTFLARLPLAWAKLRALHPALGCKVKSYEASEGDDEGVSEWMRLPRRRFVYAPPRDEREAMQGAMASLLVEPEGGRGITNVVEELALNGERSLIAFGCLARLMAFPREEEGCGLVLVISHTISDGLSVLNLVAELLRFASDAALPTPPGPPPAFRSVSGLLGGHAPPDGPAPPPYLASAWNVVMPSAEIPALLAPASEDLYPALPVAPSAQSIASAASPGPPLSDQPASLATSPQPAPPPTPSRARQRWTWAIARTLVALENARYPVSPRYPRLPPRSPPVQAYTRWAVLRLSKDTSGKLIALSKADGVSPSMLLFALLGLATASLLSGGTPVAAVPDVVFGFPFSLRPCLTGDDGMEGVPKRDTAIRIGFDSIHLPGLPPPPPGADPARTRLLALRNARLAKLQFARRLTKDPAARTQLMAAQYFLILDRMLKGLGQNLHPLSGPIGALNASMIGDVDRLLPRGVAVPGAGGAPPTTYELEDLVIGTRLHRNEGMLCEAFTFGGQVTVCLGWDRHCVDRGTVDGILAELQRVAEDVANGGA